MTVPLLSLKSVATLIPHIRCRAGTVVPHFWRFFVKRRHFVSALSVLALALAGGGVLSVSAWPTSVVAQEAEATAVDAVVKHYAALVHANYEDSVTSAKTMQMAIEAFLAKPSEKAFLEARKQWLAAREYYGQTEAFRFYGGPIDGEDGPEGQINAWPLDEAYIDYVDGDETAGLINDTNVPMTVEQLAEMNERGGEENISTGWHAIEFMLWGQDFNDNGTGNRAHTDFVDGERPNADRRRQYLKLVTQLLIDDLQSLVDAWAPGKADNYRAEFEKGGLESVRKIIVGVGSLSRGELAGERIEVAMNTQDQEDEHSCFSDNTHRDAVTNAQGIQNVWLGTYQRLDGSKMVGASLEALVATKNPALAKKTTKQIAESLAAAEGIQTPFDREILGDASAPGRKRLQRTVDSLTAQSKDLVEAAGAIGITKLTLTEPE